LKRKGKNNTEYTKKLTIKSKINNKIEGEGKKTKIKRKDEKEEKRKIQLKNKKNLDKSKKKIMGEKKSQKFLLAKVLGLEKLLSGFSNIGIWQV
jgi:hypothetical protein